MKSATLAFLAVIFLTLSGISQETKVYIQSNHDLGRFYLYVDGALMNRSPQIQVGVLGLDSLPTYSIRVVFQNPEKMPITGTIKPKKDRIRLYLLFGGTKNEVKSRKKSGVKAQPIAGNTPASHPSMPNYKGRLGCDFPIGNEVLNQVVSQMTSNLPRTPMEIAKEAVTTNCYTTNQLKQILAVLADDTERVELSKIAWYYVYDQENFKDLESVFTEPGQVQQVLSYVMKNQ